MDVISPWWSFLSDRKWASSASCSPLLCVCVCVWSQEKSQKNNQCRKRKNRNEAAVSEAKITQRGKDLRNNGKTNGKKEAMTKKAK